MCPCGCGLPRSVSQAEENEDRFTVGDPVRCHARTALGLAQEKYGGDIPEPEALMWATPELRKVSNGRSVD